MSLVQERARLAERRRAVAASLRRRMVAHLAAGGTTDFAPSVLENDPACYTDPARAEVERRELFLKQPLIAGLSCDVAAPGDCLLFEDVGPSVVVVRGNDGVLRGFLNMCRHRASRLVRAQPDGTCDHHTRFTCPFHAWTYDLQGALVGIPGRAGFEDIEPATHHLIPVPVAEWNGLVFVRPSSGDDTLDMPAFLGDFGDELAQLELGAAASIRHSRLTADCNWKVALDTYAEGYHFGTLHAASLGGTHYANVAVFDECAPHWRLGFPERTLRALVGLPEDQWPAAEYGGIHFVFPNTVLVVGTIGPDRLFVRMFRLFPGASAGTMSCRIDVYDIGGAGDAESRVMFRQDDAESEVTKEDYLVAVEGYRNLVDAPAGFKVVYGRNEPALQSFHRYVAAAIGAPSLRTSS